GWGRRFYGCRPRPEGPPAGLERGVARLGNAGPLGGLRPGRWAHDRAASGAPASETRQARAIEVKQQGLVRSASECSRPCPHRRTIRAGFRCGSVVMSPQTQGLHSVESLVADVLRHRIGHVLPGPHMTPLLVLFAARLELRQTLCLLDRHQSFGPIAVHGYAPDAVCIAILGSSIGMPLRALHKPNAESRTWTLVALPFTALESLYVGEFLASGGTPEAMSADLSEDALAERRVGGSPPANLRQ